MIVLWRNESIWMPVYIMNDSSFQSGPYLWLLISELFLYLLTLLIIVRTVRIFLTVQRVHKNMNTMMAVFLFQWLEAIIGKLIITPFQIGLLRVSDSAQPYVSWWTEDVGEMIRVADEKTVVPLQIASFLVWHYAYSMIFGILNLGVERIFASVLIKDYENKPRRFIPTALLLLTNLVTLPFSYLVLANKTGFYIGTSPCFTNSFLVFAMFLVVWKVNECRRKRTFHPARNSDYSLPQQYQLNENCRVLMLAKNLLIVVLCAMSVPCALLILLVLGWAPSFKMLFIHVMENSIYLNPIIICSVLMLSDPHWRDEYLNIVPGIKKLDSMRVFVTRPESERARVSVAEAEGIQYFQQLREAWA